MSFGVIVLAVIALLVTPVVGLAILARIFAADVVEDDQADYQVSPVRSWSRLTPLWHRLQNWLDSRPKLLTYRRDNLGRFRRVRR